MRDAFLAAFKRAARQSPLHLPVTVFTIATDAKGRFLTDKKGRFQYREIERTHGYYDRLPEEHFTTAEAYEGLTLVTVLTSAVLTDDHVIQIAGQLFAIVRVRGSDTAAVGWRVEARAIDDPESFTFVETSDDESPFPKL